MNHYADNEELYEDYINQVMFEMTEEEISKKKSKSREEYEIMLLGWRFRRKDDPSYSFYDEMLLGKRKNP